MYANGCVEVAPGGFKVCEVVHCPVLQGEFCFVNSKAGSRLMFKVFEQSNQDGVIISLSIRNKTKLPITVQRSQEIFNLYLVETVEIPGNILSSSSLSTPDKFSSSYFFVSSSFNFSFLFFNLDECEQKR